jgi:hypothetical protein
MTFMSADSAYAIVDSHTIMSKALRFLVAVTRTWWRQHHIFLRCVGVSSNHFESYLRFDVSKAFLTPLIVLLEKCALSTSLKLGIDVCRANLSRKTKVAAMAACSLRRDCRCVSRGMYPLSWETVSSSASNLVT